MGQHLVGAASNMLLDMLEQVGGGRGILGKGSGGGGLGGGGRGCRGGELGVLKLWVLLTTCCWTCSDR